MNIAHCFSFIYFVIMLTIVLQQFFLGKKYPVWKLIETEKQQNKQKVVKIFKQTTKDNQGTMPLENHGWLW